MSNDAIECQPLVEAPVLSVEYSVLGPQMTGLLDESLLVGVEQQIQRRTCYICGNEFDVYNPDEVHHVKPKGGGGSELLDVDPNKARICMFCHRRIHAGFLRFYRGDDFLLWKEEWINGQWVKQVPYGRLVPAEAVADKLDLGQQISGWLVDVQSEVATWDDEALQAQYGIAETTGALLFSLQCAIIHELADRRSVVDGRLDRKVGLEATAKFLGIAYSTARIKHAIWESVFARVPNGTTWANLSAEFFYTAYRQASRQDPITALGYAEERRLTNPTYTATQFKRDILSGLPATTSNGGTVACCPYGYAHLERTSPDDRIEIYRGGKLIASGSGEHLEYCPFTRKLARDLGPEDACEHLKEIE